MPNYVTVLIGTRRIICMRCRSCERLVKPTGCERCSKKRKRSEE